MGFTDTDELHCHSIERIISGVPQNSQGREDNWPNTIFKSTQHLKTKMRPHTRPRLETVIFVTQLSTQNPAATLTKVFSRDFFTDRWVSLGGGFKPLFADTFSQGLHANKKRGTKENQTHQSFLGCFKFKLGICQAVPHFRRAAGTVKITLQHFICWDYAT